MSWIFLVSAGILAAISNISLKHGLIQVNSSIPETLAAWQRIPYWGSNLYIWLGLMGLGTAAFCYLSGLSHTRLNVAYPILVGLEYSLVMILSWLILGEVLPPFKLAGIACVLIGIIVIAY